ncbi:MAG: O-antigen ligase family protein [Gammaproteobacteria bacterium]|nr:O-antigen ligase family protein [Gammaproteobacteria bacterium]
MFDTDSTSHVVQLLLALGSGISLFIFGYMGFQRQLFKVLIVIIPFQFIESRYGSLNMAVAYVLGASMFLNQSWIRKKTKENWPLIWPIFMIIISFFLSWVLAPRIIQGKTLFYMIMLGSNIFLFYMAYQFVSDMEDVVDFFNLFLFCNVLVIIYCGIQFLIGASGYSFLGIKELSFCKNVRGLTRMVGPFGSIGILAEYIVIQNMLLTYYALNADKYRKLILAVLFCNVAILIGTGNRGGFISFILSLFLFCYVFRKRFGLKKILIISLAFLIALVSASQIMINYTTYNVIYDRLLTTQMEGITPDTRGGPQGWSSVVEKIIEKPVLGHGPRLIRPDKHGKLPEGEYGHYPHNLYLHILYTMGILGFFAYSVLGVRYITILRKSKMNLDKNDNFLSGLPELGIIVFAVFLFDQMKIEFLRVNLLDYQHYLSVLFGMFCGLRRIERKSNELA